MKYNIKGVTEDIQSDKRDMGVNTMRIERTVDLSIPKPDVDTDIKAVPRSELMDKVEMSHQKAGKVWNETRPLASK